MWYRNENGSNVKPESVDSTSSKQYVYIRKDFEEVASTEEIPAHWTWMELKIRKEEYPVYLQAETNAANIDYIAMMTDVEIPTEEDE